MIINAMYYVFKIPPFTVLDCSQLLYQDNSHRGKAQPVQTVRLCKVQSHRSANSMRQVVCMGMLTSCCLTRPKWNLSQSNGCWTCEKGSGGRRNAPLALLCCKITKKKKKFKKYTQKEISETGMVMP